MIEMMDGMRTTVDVVLCLKDKLRVLLGAPIRVYVNVDTQYVIGDTETKSSVSVGRIPWIPRKKEPEGWAAPEASACEMCGATVYGGHSEEECRAFLLSGIHDS